MFPPTIRPAVRTACTNAPVQLSGTGWLLFGQKQTLRDRTCCQWIRLTCADRAQGQSRAIPRGHHFTTNTFLIRSTQRPDSTMRSGFGLQVRDDMLIRGEGGRVVGKPLLDRIDTVWEARRCFKLSDSNSTFRLLSQLLRDTIVTGG